MPLSAKCFVEYVKDRFTVGQAEAEVLGDRLPVTNNVALDAARTTDVT